MAVISLNVKVTPHMTCVTSADRYSHLLPSLQRKGQAAQTVSTTPQRIYMEREDKFQRVSNPTHTTVLEWSTIISRSFHLEDRHHITRPAELHSPCGQSGRHQFTSFPGIEPPISCPQAETLPTETQRASCHPKWQKTTRPYYISQHTRVCTNVTDLAAVPIKESKRNDIYVLRH